MIPRLHQVGNVLPPCFVKLRREQASVAPRTNTVDKVEEAAKREAGGRCACHADDTSSHLTAAPAQQYQWTIKCDRLKDFYTRAEPQLMQYPNFQVEKLPYSTGGYQTSRGPQRVDLVRGG